jgi:NAD-dependent SIR2 family protein deacetylase
MPERVAIGGLFVNAFSGEMKPPHRAMQMPEQKKSVHPIINRNIDNLPRAAGKKLSQQRP